MNNFVIMSLFIEVTLSMKDKVGKLWPEVRRELRTWDGVAPLLWRDLRSQWSEDVVCVDASPWGLGAVLHVDGVIVEVLSDALQEQDLKRFGLQLWNALSAQRASGNSGRLSNCLACAAH